MIETPRYDLTLFKIHFGNLTLKAYTKGEHVLRFEAMVHNTKQLGCGRVLARFPEIIARLAGMVDRFTTTLDCVDTTFIGDGFLDQLPAPTQIGTAPPEDPLVGDHDQRPSFTPPAWLDPARMPRPGGRHPVPAAV